MIRTIGFYCLLGCVILTGCREKAREGENIKTFLLEVRGEEEQAEVTARLQFFGAASRGRSLALPQGGTVRVDEVPLQADSASLSGAYYEAGFSKEQFAGSHRLQVLRDGAPVVLPFRFRVLGLKEEPPAELDRARLVLRLSGVGPEPVPVRVVLVDTAFRTDDFHQIRTAANGELVLDRGVFAGLAPGPLYLELQLEEEEKVQDKGLQGTIRSQFVLRRQLQLRP